MSTRTKKYNFLKLNIYWALVNDLKRKRKKEKDRSRALFSARAIQILGVGLGMWA